MERKQGRPGNSGSKSGSDSGGTASLRGVRPWGNFAKKYFDAGWCPLPLPPRKKSSPPTGSTGRYEMPDEKKIRSWAKTRDSRGNIALRVPDRVIGIDVDAYDKKVGAEGLAQMEAEFGPLPPTWTLTARKDGVSGIRFFRVPEGLHWPGEPVPDVQIVQNHHRYAVAYPSVHPDTKGMYLWYAPEDTLNGRPSVTVENEIPNIEELSELPASWVEGLTSGLRWQALPSDLNATRADVQEWIKQRPVGTMCRLMRKQSEAAVEEIGVGGAHDALNSRVYSMISLSVEGHIGLSRALRIVRDAFYAEVTAVGRKGRRSRPEAISEFSRIRDGAVRIMIASIADGEGTLEDECSCTGSSLDWGEKLGVVVEDLSPSATGARGRARIGKAKAPDKYTFDDSGNAEHLLDILDNTAYYVAGEKAWYFWSPALGAWQTDPDNSRVWEMAQLVGKRCRELSDEYMDRLRAAGSSLTLDAGGDTATKIGQLDKHAKVSSDRKGLESMVKVASVQSRAKRVSTDFDQDPSLISCLNGTLVLSPSGIDFRQNVREDLIAHSTGVEFERGAVSAAWDAYLERFIPDPDVARYVQKIAGYTLYGGNPERKMFFMQGGTSTGKTTFVNAFNDSLGQYAGTMNLSLFRDNQDEKPRADLVYALTRRLLSASEASAEWYLHGDQIKRLTGGDPISARLLYSSSYVRRVPLFTPWIATNSMPQVRGADAALHRRLRCVPFREVVQEGQEDFSVAVALASAEGRGAVLAWAVRGWELYREDGHLKEPAAVVAATQEMADELSELDVFLKEMTVKDSDGRVKASDLFDKWCLWAEDNRAEMKLSANKFGRELTGRGYGVFSTTKQGERVKMRTGLAWR